MYCTSSRGTATLYCTSSRGTVTLYCTPSRGTVTVMYIVTRYCHTVIYTVTLYTVTSCTLSRVVHCHALSRTLSMTCTIIVIPFQYDCSGGGRSWVKEISSSVSPLHCTEFKQMHGQRRRRTVKTCQICVISHQIWRYFRLAQVRVAVKTSLSLVTCVLPAFTRNRECDPFANMSRHCVQHVWNGWRSSNLGPMVLAGR